MNNWIVMVVSIIIGIGIGTIIGAWFHDAIFIEEDQLLLFLGGETECQIWQAITDLK